MQVLCYLHPESILKQAWISMSFLKMKKAECYEGVKPEDLAYFEKMLQECIPQEVMFEMSLKVKWELIRQRKMGERPVQTPSGKEEL